MKRSGATGTGLLTEASNVLIEVDNKDLISLAEKATHLDCEGEGIGQQHDNELVSLGQRERERPSGDDSGRRGRERVHQKENL